MFERDRLCVSDGQSPRAIRHEAVALMGRNAIQPSIIKAIASARHEIRKLRRNLDLSEQVLRFARAVADRIPVLERGRILHEDRREDADIARITGHPSVRAAQ